MKPFSITRRLLAWLTVSTMVFWSLAAGLGAYVMHYELGEMFDSAMRRTAERLVPLVVDALQDEGGSNEPALTPASDAAIHDYLTYEVRDSTGKVLLHSLKNPPPSFGAPLTPGFWQDEHTRAYTVALPDRAIFVQVIDTIGHRTETMRDGALALLLPIILLVPLNIIALLMIVGSATRPLTDLRRSIAAKDTGNLSPISSDGLPRELQPIANSLNLVLERLGSALSAEREFTANSAHELRTPLAGAIAQAQMHIQELGQSPFRDRAELIESSLQRLSRVTEKLLQLSRADAGIGLSEKPQDLMPVVSMLIEDMGRRSELKRGIEVIETVGASLILQANVDAFAIVMRNLLENAVEHSEPGSRIIVTVGDHFLTVANQAKPYAPEELENLRRRFVRDDALSDGSGLGLSIVDRFVRQMNATLELQSTAEGGRSLFEATVRFSAP